MHFLDPQKILQHFAIEPGMHVAELHAGSGHFTPHLIKSVGTYGIVHSFQHSDEHDAIEVAELVDRVLAINLPSHAAPQVFFKKAYKVLKSGGKIIVVNVKHDPFFAEYFSHLAGLSGFIPEKSFYAGDHHFGLVFKKV